LTYMVDPSNTESHLRALQLGINRHANPEHEENIPISQGRNRGEEPLSSEPQRLTETISKERTRIISPAVSSLPPPPGFGHTGECAICLDEYQSNEKIANMECGHAFHQMCYNTWNESKDNTCPMCRRKSKNVAATQNGKEMHLVDKIGNSKNYMKEALLNLVLRYMENSSACSLAQTKLHENVIRLCPPRNSHIRAQPEVIGLVISELEQHEILNHVGDFQFRLHPCGYYGYEVNVPEVDGSAMIEVFDQVTKQVLMVNVQCWKGKSMLKSIWVWMRE